MDSLSEFSKIKRLTEGWPEGISYNTGDKEIDDYYDKNNGAVSKRTSFFYKKRLLDIFIYAMAIGKKLGKHTSFTDRSYSMPVDALKEDEIWLMISVALSEKNNDLKLFENPKEIVRTCEEYANAGIKPLIELDRITSIDNPNGSFEEKLQELLKDLN